MLRKFFTTLSGSVSHRICFVLSKKLCLCFITFYSWLGADVLFHFSYSVICLIRFANGDACFSHFAGSNNFPLPKRVRTCPFSGHYICWTERFGTHRTKMNSSLMETAYQKRPLFARLLFFRPQPFLVVCNPDNILPNMDGEAVFKWKSANPIATCISSNRFGKFNRIFIPSLPFNWIFFSHLFSFTLRGLKFSFNLCPLF